MKTRIFSQFLSSLKPTESAPPVNQSRGAALAFTAALLIPFGGLPVSAHAATIPFSFTVTYDIFLGGVPSPGALTVPASNSGSGSFAPFGAAIYSEVGTATFAALPSGDLALSTVSLNFKASFNGGADTITGTDFHVTGVSEIWTILGGTGIFSGATGVLTPVTIEVASSGNPAPGFVGTLNTSGSGQITAPGLTAAPEPATMALSLAGLVGVVTIRRRRSKLIRRE